MLKRRVSAAGALAATAAMVLAGAPAHAADVTVTEQIGGKDRYATAVAVSQAAFPDTTDVVYVASGKQFPDALSAGAVAVHEGGALLVTEPDRLLPGVRAEISRLAPERIVIVGGTSALSAAVERSLKPLAKSVTRLGGADRYATSRLLAEKTFTGPVENLYLATGRDFPDALSAVPAAARADSPVLLVDGRAGSLDAASTALIKKLAPKTATIVGGNSAVADRLERDVKAVVPSTERKAGTNRYETSADVGMSWDSAPHAYAATGADFPDALTGAVLAGMKGEPLFLIQPGCQAAAVNAARGWTGTEELTLLGGPAITIAEPPTARSCVVIDYMIDRHPSGPDATPTPDPSPTASATPTP